MEAEHRRERVAWWGRIAAPVVFALVLLAPLPEAFPPEARRTAAVALLMAIWWMSEALPLAVTALVPIVLFPTLGILPVADATTPYANPVIFLFLGGFLIAMAMQRWGLHRRIALGIVAWIGTGPYRLVAGFMAATAFLSMWISNTATAAMMVPIGIALAELLRPDRVEEGHYNFGVALMLGIAYAASIGGMATLIGSPPNAVFAAAAAELLGRPIGFVEWMQVGLPTALVMLPITWALLVLVVYRPGALPGGAAELLRQEREALGPMSRGEAATLAVFCLAALGWLLREPKAIGALQIPGITTFLPGVDDAMIAIFAGILLFAIPIEARRGVFVMDWKSAKGLPWDVLILFGGGLSLARAFEVSGLTTVIAQAVTGLGGVPLVVLLVAVVAAFVYLSELASNTAMAAMAMPVLAGAAAGIGQDPLVLMAAGALAASTAFMLPVGTPPNAIVFGSGYITMRQMLRAGMWLNLIAVAAVTGMAYLLVTRVFG